jgi:hypothetical protein
MEIPPSGRSGLGVKKSYRWGVYPVTHGRFALNARRRKGDDISTYRFSMKMQTRDKEWPSAMRFPGERSCVDVTVFLRK